MPRPLVLLVNRSLLFFGFVFLFVLFPVRSLAQSPSITDVRSNNVVDYTGAVGQDVKINGSNFGSSQGSSTVTFNGTAATVTTWSATAIYTNVPSGATSGNLIVTVGGAASNAVSFTVLARPNIVTLRDVNNANNFTGAIGQWVKIIGGGFGTSQGSSTTTFNGTAVTTITSWAANAIYTYVPSGASSGNLVVTVGGVASNTISFTVTAGPNILTVRHNNVDVTSGIVGDALKIMGGGFGTSQGSSTITLNGTTATATSWAADVIYTAVPSGATSGNLVVTVGGTASNNYSFTVLPTPTISSVTPTTGGAGTVVQISGSDFGSSQSSSTVKINGASVGTASTWQATNIGFTMPAGLSSGNLIVTVNGVSSSATSFTVTTTPTIYSVAPTTAGAGDVIQISGCNFGSSQGSSTVKINGTSVGTADVWQQGYISFTMPTGLSSGNLQVTAGGVASNTESFTVTQPSITSISPTSGAPGLHVTINGSHFGSSQGSVTFYNGHNASIYSWSSTQIVAIVPASVTTGNLVATVGGVQLSGGTFTAVAPPTVTSSVFPAANGAGWHNMNVTVTYTCTAGGLALASCSSPQVVSSDGTDQTVSGGATDVNGDVAETSVTLDIDKTKPALTISSPEDGSSTSSSSVTVSGTLSDTLSGTSDVTCNGTATTLSSGSFSCNISLDVGVNLVVIRGTDAAGNVSAANYHITRTGSFGTPTSLTIMPTEVNMVVGDVQQFSVVDQDGHVRTDATWEVDDTDIATLPDEDTPELTAVDAGDVTLTATIGSVSAEVEVHVLEGTSLTDGTIRWSAPLASGHYVQQIIQAQPVPGGPDLYSIEDGSTILVRALTADGRQMWTASFTSQYFQAWPEANGGVLLQLTPISGSYSNLIALDAQTGAQLWAYQTARQYPGTLSSDQRQLAIGADGVVFDRQNGYNPTKQLFEPALLALDGATGTPIAQYQLPRQTYTIIEAACNGQPSHTNESAPIVTPPFIGPDGTAFAAITVGHITDEYSSCGNHLKSGTYDMSLMRLTADGSVTVAQFEELNWGPSSGIPFYAYARRLIPDGADGALVAWDRDNSTEYHIAHVTSEGTTDYALPFTYGPPGEMVLGENGTAYASNLGEIFKFDMGDGSVIWSNDLSSNYPNGSHIIASAADDGLVVKGKDSNDLETIVRFDDEGTPTVENWTGSNIDYRIGDMWLGAPSGSLGRYVAPFLKLSTASFYSPSMAQSNRADQAMTVTSFSRSEPNQTTIEGMVQELITATSLSTFTGGPDCKEWIETSSSSNELVQLQYSLDNDFYGHGVVTEAPQDGQLFINGAVTGYAIPNENVLTIVNDDGPFFNAGPAQGIAKYQANTPRARATILTHEFGHQLDLPTFETDGGRPIAQWWNDLMVATYCGPMVDALPRIEGSNGGLSATSGAANSTVTINGANFGTTTGTAKFNGVTATLTGTGWSSSSVTVQVPSGGTGRVTVTDSQGVTATGPTFTVTQ